MKSFIKRARKIHRSEKGFTLIELLVVMAILAVLVGLVLPNFFGITDEADSIQIQGQHEKMREAVYLYYTDTGEWPTEWSGSDLAADHHHQLWLDADDITGGALTVGGWDGPYLDRPILQENKWGGNWGVVESRRLNLAGANNTPGAGGELYTALLYENVPLEVAEALDAAMDDGERTTGAVQYGGLDWPHNHVDSGGPADDDNFLAIIIAKQ
ncbi:MAG: Type II secretion system protein G [Dehalococcoidia bacterium]|nr:Type II secretion system protein G [Bacillota bacterium]